MLCARLVSGDATRTKRARSVTAVSAAAFFRAGRDSTAVRVVAVLRVAALLSVAGIGSFVAASHGRVAHLLLLIGLIGVPWSTIVFFCADRPDNRIALYGGPLGDLLLLFAVQSVLDGAVEPVLPGYLVLVAFSVYTVGRSFATVIVTGAIALTLVAHQIGPATSTCTPRSRCPCSSASSRCCFCSTGRPRFRNRPPRRRSDCADGPTRSSITLRTPCLSLMAAVEWSSAIRRQNG